MKKWILIVPVFFFSAVLLAANSHSTQQASASAPSMCDSSKIEGCMQGCIKQINPSSTSTSAISKINKCVEACSSQGCQVAKK